MNEKENFQKNFDRSLTNERKSDQTYLEQTFNLAPGQKIINSTIADIDFATPSPIVEAIIQRAKQRSYSYTYVTKQFYEAVQSWYQTQHNIKLNSNNIKLVHGTVNALHQLSKALTQNDEAILINTPVYGPFLRAVNHANRKAVFLELDWVKESYEFNFEKFEELIAKNNIKLFIFCNPHNPGGKVWSKEILIKILDICRKHKITLISDEVHSDLVLKDYKFTSFLEITNDNDLVIIANSPNKSFNLGGLKSSYLISKNTGLIMQVNQIFEINSLTSPNVFVIPAIVAAYTNNEVKEWLINFRKVINDNFNYLKTELANLKNLKIMNLEASYLVWCEYKNLSYETFQNLTKNFGIIFSDYQDFANASKNSFRINIACDRLTIKKICNFLIVNLNK